MSSVGEEDDFLPIEDGIKISRTKRHVLKRLPPGAAVFTVFLFSIFVGVILQLSSELLFRPHVAMVMYVAGQAPQDQAMLAAAGKHVDSAVNEDDNQNKPLQRPQFVSEELNSKWLSLGLISIPSTVDAATTQVKAISMTWGSELAKQIVHTNLDLKYSNDKLGMVCLNKTTDPTYAELILETIRSVDNASLSNEYKWVIWTHYQLYINTEILRKLLLAMDPSFPVVASIEHPERGLKVPPIIILSFPAISILSSRLDTVFYSSDGESIEIQPHQMLLMGVKYINLQDTIKKIHPPAKKVLLTVNDQMLTDRLTSINALSESLIIGPIIEPTLMFKLGYYLYEQLYTELEKKLDEIVQFHNLMQNRVPARLSNHEVWPNGINPPFKPHIGEDNIPWDQYDYSTSTELSSVLEHNNEQVKRPEKRAIQNMLGYTRDTCSLFLPDNSNTSSLEVKEIKKRFSPGYGYEYRMILTSPSGDEADEDTYLMKTAIPLGDAIEEVIVATSDNLHVNIILPLTTVDEELKLFMRNYEAVCLKKTLPLGITISLHVVMFQMFELTQLKKLVYHYVTDYPHANITMQEAEEATNLMQAAFFKASALDDNPLIWFTNVSFQFSADFMQQCALFPYKQKIYFPIPRNSKGSAWVHDSYTNVCGYASDITTANRYVETLADEEGELSYDIFDWYVKHQSLELVRSPTPEVKEVNLP